MCPMIWQLQYSLTKGHIPENVKKLQDSLERIEKAFPLETVKPEKHGKKSNGDSKMGMMVSFSDQITKCKQSTFREASSTKHCAL